MPTLSFGDINLYYEIHGSGPPFFLHHGLTSSCQAWYEHLPWLTKNHQVIVHDARGHGLTTAPVGDDRYSWEIMCDDLNRLVEHLGIEQAIVGGLSMGSGVALNFALKYPQKVSALILSDNAGTGIAQPATEELLEQQEKRETVIRNYGVVEWGRRTIAANLVSNPSLEHEIWQNQYLERLARFPVNGAIHAIRFVTRTVVPGQEGTKDLTMPTLIVIGEEDEGCIRGAEWLRDTIPNRRYAFLKDVGHGTSRYKPLAWRKAIEEFLNDFGAGQDIHGEHTY